MPKAPDRADRTRVYVPTQRHDDGPPRDKAYYATLRGLSDQEVVRRAGATVYTRDALEELLARVQHFKREATAAKLAIDAINEAYQAVKAERDALKEQANA